MKYIPPIGAEDPDASYVDGDPANGVEGTPVSSRAWEHPMRELMAVIEEAGLEGDEEDLTQVLQAIQTLIAAALAPDASTTVKGLVELATGAEALAGTDAVRAITAAALASAQDLSSNGYMKLPGGLLLQWGNYAFTTTGDAIKTSAFPIAFPNECLVAVPTMIKTGGGSAVIIARLASITTTEIGVGIELDTTSTSSGTIYYIALGK